MCDNLIMNQELWTVGKYFGLLFGLGKFVWAVSQKP